MLRFINLRKESNKNLSFYCKKYSVFLRVSEILRAPDRSDLKTDKAF